MTGRGILFGKNGRVEGGGGYLPDLPIAKC